MVFISKHKIKRFFLKIYIRFKRLFNSNKRVRYPKQVEDSEKTAAHIFLKILKDPDTKLSYDPKTLECYLRSEKHNLYLFLESQNLKVINTIYGYDVKLSSRMEYYLNERFQHQMSKRRQIFKQEAISKVQYSLDKTLKNILRNENYNL